VSLAFIAPQVYDFSLTIRTVTTHLFLAAHFAESLRAIRRGNSAVSVIGRSARCGTSANRVQGDASPKVRTELASVAVNRVRGERAGREAGACGPSAADFEPGQIAGARGVESAKALAARARWLSTSTRCAVGIFSQPISSEPASRCTGPSTMASRPSTVPSRNCSLMRAADCWAGEQSTRRRLSSRWTMPKDLPGFLYLSLRYS